MADRTLRGKVAIVGVGQSAYYRHGEAPASEFKLALEAIVAAAADAGISPAAIDSFASFSDDRCEPSRLAAALGCKELRCSNLQWGGRGGGASAAIGNAAAAIATGMADIAVVWRSIAQGQTQRFSKSAPEGNAAGEPALTAPYGIAVPAQRFALRVNRFLHEHGLDRDILRSIALASYHHAQRNPHAVMHGKPLTAEAYDASRWIAEPFRLYDCCMENDGAAAMILVAADRARDHRHEPAYILAVAQGSEHRNGARGFNAPSIAGASFTSVAPRLWSAAGVGPAEADVVQSYENFTGGVLMSLIEHGFCSTAAASEVLAPANLLAPGGGLPLNTSGGNLAECYVQGFGLQLEAVRQVRGTSCNQVPGARVSVVCAGPMVTPVSSMVLGHQETL